jgi:hypothetical protein
MDIRQDQQVQNQPHHQKNRQQMSNERSLKYQHIGEQQVSYRFNEWDPFGKPINDTNKTVEQQQQQQQQTVNERKKSPLKQKHSREQSPRQSTSGRGTLASASLTQQSQDRNSNDLELLVSGQKFGRKESSPTNTPREVAVAVPAALRPPTRRLQPIDRNSESYLVPVEVEPINSPKQAKNSEIQNKKSNKKLVFVVTWEGFFKAFFLFSSKGSNLLDRKKLEPIRNQYGLMQNSYDNEFDSKNSTSQYLEDEQSVSENTISSDKQQIRIPKNKVKFYQLVETYMINFFYFFIFCRIQDIKGKAILVVKED